MRIVALVAVAAVALPAAAGCGLDKEGLATGAGLGDDAGDGATDAAQGGADVGAGGGDDASGGSSGANGSSGGSGSGSSSGAGSSGSSSGGDASTTSGACVAAIPAGWNLVVYETSQDACPGGYGASHDAYTGAVAGAGACSCTCAIDTPPDCTVGKVGTSYGNGMGVGGGGATCNTQGESLQANGSTCSPLAQAGSLTQFFAAQPVAFSGGACTGTATGDTGQVMKEGVRFCDVPSPSAETVCEGTSPKNFASCIAHDGDVACPAGSPFASKTSVADDEMLVCSACSSCSVSGTCTGAQVQFFSDGACTMPLVMLPASGQCVPTNNQSRPIAAVEYSAQTSATCQATGTSASFNPVMPHTLCCR